MSPGGSVEALDDTAEGVTGGVLDGNQGEGAALFNQLDQSHKCVVYAAFGLCLDRDALLGDMQDIALIGTVGKLGQLPQGYCQGQTVLGYRDTVIGKQGDMFGGGLVGLDRTGYDVALFVHDLGGGGINIRHNHASGACILGLVVGLRVGDG